MVKSIYYPPLKTLNGYANICICYCVDDAGGLTDPFVKGYAFQSQPVPKCVSHTCCPHACVSVYLN